VKLGSGSGEMFLGRDVGHQRDYSDGVAERIDAEVRALIDAAHDEAWKVLTANRPILDQLAKELLEKETLDHVRLAAIFAKVKKLPARPVWKSNPKRPVSTKGPIKVPARISLDATDKPESKTAAKAKSTAKAKPAASRTKPAAK
jgi:cell division protease FtsH